MGDERAEPNAGADRGGSRRRSVPLSAVALATLAAALVTALVVSVLVDDDGDAEATRGTLVLRDADDLTGEAVPGVDLSGSEAPDFPFEPLGQPDDEVEFSAWRDGRPAVVNFFASWCAPCVSEMPDFEAVHQQLGDEVAFLGLAEREAPEESAEIVERTGVTYDIGRDPAGDILTAFQGLAMPTTVLVAADGTITSVHSGALTADDLRSRIDTELR